MAKILVVDDEKVLVKGITFNLKNEGYQVETGYDGEEAVELAREGNFDLIILDLMMPKIDGLQACMRIREFSNVPIIMLTARSEDTDKIIGFECGADDYITKPFNILELKARVRALLRRDFAPRSAAVSAGALTLDAQRREITADGAALPLTRKEFELLEYLMLHPERTVSQEELLDHIWESDSNPFSHSVRMHISSLRKKLRQALGYDPIVTKIGQGYRLEVER